MRLKYFVLRPGGIDIFAFASRAALRAFSAEIGKDDPELAEETACWAIEESRKAQKAIGEKK